MNQHDFFSKNVLIGFAQPPDKLLFRLSALLSYSVKLVFVALTPNFLSLRDQSADWSWQSPG